MSKNITRKEGNINWMLSYPDPTPIAFFRNIFPTHRGRAIEKYRNILNLAFNEADNQEMKDKLKKMKETIDVCNWMVFFKMLLSYCKKLFLTLRSFLIGSEDTKGLGNVDARKNSSMSSYLLLDSLI